jgi:thiol:disulfide interchange protein DsbD
MNRTALLALVCSFFFAAPALSETPTKFEQVGAVSVEVTPAQAKRGQTVAVKLTVSPKPGAWTYPAKPKDTDQLAKNSLRLPDPGTLVFVKPVADPLVAWKEKQREDAPNGVMDQYFPGAVTWEFAAVVSPQATIGKQSVGLDKRSRIQVCVDGACLSPRSLPTAELEILGGDPVPVEEPFRAAVEKAVGTSPQPPAPKVDPPLVKPGNTDKATSPSRGGDGPKSQRETAPEGQYPPKEPKPISQYHAELDAIKNVIDKSELTNDVKKESIGAFVMAAVFWGLISLVTPCVFPMIPITVSIFMKHAHGSFRERMKLAGAYSLTIIIVLGLSAFALLKFMAWLSAHPVTNVLLGLLFLAMALSLFGMYDLALPGFISRRLQAKQAKGGVMGTVFGALAFTVISFTCVAPFLGGFAGISAADSNGGSLIAVPTLKEVLGGLAFATAFALPFFILALIPGLLKSLPKSGGWLDSVKVVMAFLELAAALKFFRTAELRVFSPTEFFTYDLVLAGWVGMSFACGLYLLNVYRLPHDEERPNIGVPRLLFALLFLGLGAYLLPGMFKTSDGTPQRPNGAVYAWIDAFLLPEPKHVDWGSDLPDAVEKGRADVAKGVKPKPIILDFTGVTCTNCKYNESTVFPQAKVHDLLVKFERVQLYTDDVPTELYETDPGGDARNDEGAENKDFKIAVFDNDQLPLYAALVPTANGKVKVLGVYEGGKINSVDKFAKWLKDMLAKAKTP